MSSRPVVAADLEGTLTEGETWRSFGRYLSEHGHREYRAFVRSRLPRVVAARIGIGDAQAFRNRWMADLAGFFAGSTEAELVVIARWIVDRELWPRRRQAVLDELAVLQAAGARLLLVSGTYQPVLTEFATRIGAEAFGSALALHDGRATGAIAGVVNTGQAKVQTLRDVLGGGAPTTAYGDSWADAPMLEASDGPVAVHPDRKLRKLAEQRRWRILLD